MRVSGFQGSGFGGLHRFGCNLGFEWFGRVGDLGFWGLEAQLSGSWAGFLHKAQCQAELLSFFLGF